MSGHFTRIATRYANAVLKDGAYEGRPCGKLEIATCQRFLDDLSWQTSEDFEWQYYAPAAEQACEYMECLPHSKGHWAKRTATNDGLIHLEAWQAFFYCNIFGWFHKNNTERRFREFYLEVARKNTKTTMLASVALYMATSDGEYAPEIFLGATSERQAKIAFNMTRQMAKKAEQYNGFTTAFDMKVFVERIDLPNQGIIEPLPANPGDGSSPSFAGIDEFHEHRNDRLINSMETGMGGRLNPLTGKITTAGYNYAGPCWAHRRRMIDLLNGKIDADRIFAMIFCPDNDDDWHDFENWKKSNPMYGVSVSESYLRGQKTKAEQSSRDRNSILTKNYNQWRHAFESYFDISAWVAGNIELAKDVSLEELKTAKCAAALDCAYKNDLVSFLALFEVERDAGPLYFVKPYFFLPEDTVFLEENAHYQDYAEKGEIIVTPGGITDFKAVEEHIVKFCQQHPGCEVMYYDEFGAVQIAQGVLDHPGIDIEVIQFLQRAKYYTEPMRWTEALMKARRFRHEGSQCMTWCLGNVVAKDYSDRGVMPKKETRDKKIDGAITLIMAMTHFCEEETDSSYLDDNELVIL